MHADAYRACGDRGVLHFALPRMRVGTHGATDRAHVVDRRHPARRIARAGTLTLSGLDAVRAVRNTSPHGEVSGVPFPRVRSTGRPHSPRDPEPTPRPSGRFGVRTGDRVAGHVAGGDEAPGCARESGSGGSLE